MILINSGEYIPQELKSELGIIPPAFLPIKNARLYKHQIDLFEGNDPVFISIPENYLIKPFDLDLIEKYGVKIIRIPPLTSLGESIFISLGVISSYTKSIKILHGDTLIFDLPTHEGNIYAISNYLDNYDWGVIDSKSSMVYAGYFSINDLELFRECLKIVNFNFLNALNLYQGKVNVELIKVEKWLDFGHLNTYYRSKSLLPSVRYFNNMLITENIVEKSSSNNVKIKAESFWYNNFPTHLRYYLPQWLGSSVDNEVFKYRIEYQYLITLNELYVFGEQNLVIWKKIINSCFNFLRNINTVKNESHEKYLNNNIYSNKSISRINDFLSENTEYSNVLYYEGVRMGTLLEIISEVETYIPIPLIDHISIVHGDFCFSNILYDFRKQDIKVIDPRGMNISYEFDIYGDIRYDYSKLAHSIIGHYDEIIAENYILSQVDFDFKITFFDSDLNEEIKNFFWSKIDELVDLQITREVILAGTINLFLSMLPLHKESHKRQLALLANSLRLYKKLLDK